MIDFMAVMWCLPSIRISRTLSVKKFWDKLRVITEPMYGNILAIVSSLILFLMNLTVFAFEPFRNSAMIAIVESPNSAFVKSTNSNVSLAKASATFSNFSGSLIFDNFFLLGLSIFSWWKELSLELLDIFDYLISSDTGGDIWISFIYCDGFSSF